MSLLKSMRRVLQLSAAHASRPRFQSDHSWLRRLLRVEALEDRCLPSTVTNLADSGPGSLRDALANTPGGGTVDFQAGLTGTIVLTSGSLNLGNSVTIDGPGSGIITVSGNHAFSVFVNSTGRTVTISGLTVTSGGGARTYDGGGIVNNGRMTIANSVITGNSTVLNPNEFNNDPVGGGGDVENTGWLTITNSTISRGNAAVNGGGIGNAGTLTITNSTISDNNAGQGGGIWSNGGTVTITNSTIAGNFAQGGAGIDLQGGPMTITGSTISNNTASAVFGNSGGGIFNQGTLTITNCTLSGNAASLIAGPATPAGIQNNGTLMLTSSTIRGNAGDGIYWASTFQLRNTIVALNNGRDIGSRLPGGVVSLGHNLIGDGTGSGLTNGVNRDLVGTSTNPIDPRLGPLQNNGGPTQTMALLPGSPAIAAGDPTNATQWDQRGPGYARVVNGGTDIGAYQVQEITASGQTIFPTEGTAFTAVVASFTYRHPNVPAASFTATITWGDGAPATPGTVSISGTTFRVTGNHTYAAAGSFSLHVTIRDSGGNAATTDTTVSVADAPLTATGFTLVATERVPFHGVAATFTDANPFATAAQFTATITWGDGQTSAGVITATGQDRFEVSSDNTYAREGPYPVTIRVVDAGGSLVTITGTVHVGRSGPPPANLRTVANALTHSAEYYTNFIMAAYQRYLGRTPEPAGLAAWLGAMQQGLSDERLEASFIGSPEYIQNHGGTGEAWVRGLYHDLLGRDPDAWGLQTWLDALRAGISPAQIAYGFAASPEREGQRITDDYRRYLARDPEAGIVPVWVNAFLHGASNEDVAAGFLSSPEYFQKHYNNSRDWLFSSYQDALRRAPEEGAYTIRLPVLQGPSVPTEHSGSGAPSAPYA